jgi:hypothetical protein
MRFNVVDLSDLAVVSSGSREGCGNFFGEAERRSKRRLFLVSNSYEA